VLGLAGSSAFDRLCGVADVRQTWEPEENLDECDLLVEYKEKHGMSEDDRFVDR